MVKLLVGGKGSGKTKRLIDCVNKALATSKGNVICIEKEDLLRFQLSYKVRLVATDAYGICGYDAFYGMLCGICAGDIPRWSRNEDHLRLTWAGTMPWADA